MFELSICCLSIVMLYTLTITVGHMTLGLLDWRFISSRILSHISFNSHFKYFRSTKLLHERTNTHLTVIKKSFDFDWKELFLLLPFAIWMKFWNVFNWFPFFLSFVLFFSLSYSFFSIFFFLLSSKTTTNHNAQTVKNTTVKSTWKHWRKRAIRYSYEQQRKKKSKTKRKRNKLFRRPYSTNNAESHCSAENSIWK